MVAVTVTLLSGRTILATEVDPSDSVKSLVENVQQAMDGKLCDLLGPDGQKLKRRASIEDCSIADGDTLIAMLRSGPPPIQPTLAKCLHRRLAKDVSIGAQHEGWGRKWSTLSYDCVACGDRIDPGSSVVACLACKAFWHKCCYADKARSPAKAASSRTEPVVRGRSKIGRPLLKKDKDSKDKENNASHEACLFASLKKDKDSKDKESNASHEAVPFASLKKDTDSKDKESNASNEAVPFASLKKDKDSKDKESNASHEAVPFASPTTFDFESPEIAARGGVVLHAFATWHRCCHADQAPASLSSL